MIKKGQLKIQQMAFLLMAITIFFVLAGVFILTLKYSDLRGSATLLNEENAMLLASKIANSPEFSCGASFGGNKIDCIDADKVMALKQNADNYKYFWGIENIEIVKVPLEFNGTQCTLNNYPRCDRIKIYEKETRGVDSSNFVSLCKKESFEGESYNKCDVAKVMVTYKRLE